jgi:hypothetical protein
MCAQQHAKGACQWHQEAEAFQVCEFARHGPKVSSQPKVCQEIQWIEANARLRINYSIYRKLR